MRVCAGPIFIAQSPGQKGGGFVAEFLAAERGKKKAGAQRRPSLGAGRKAMP